jgi:uncharacterized protein (UPF0548 family)
MSRRSTFTDQSVTYGAIGATLDPEFLRYPPEGFRPAEDSVKLGSGAERFERAAEQLMTWGVQQGSGFTVTDVAAGTGAQYTGIAFDAEGAPIGAQDKAAEQRFAADGTPFISAGMTAVLRDKHHQIPVLVVYVIDEPNRVGFAYGTAGDAPEHGEESFILDRRDDDSVWLTVRSILEPAGGIHRLTAPMQRRRRRGLTTRQLRALHPAFPS